MQPRIERRRTQCSRWLLYLVIALSASVLARLASAAPPLEAAARLALPAS
jgi:hypothetical protein